MTVVLISYSFYWYEILLGPVIKTWSLRLWASNSVGVGPVLGWTGMRNLHVMWYCKKKFSLVHLMLSNSKLVACTSYSFYIYLFSNFWHAYATDTSPVNNTELGLFNLSDVFLYSVVYFSNIAFRAPTQFTLFSPKIIIRRWLFWLVPSNPLIFLLYLIILFFVFSSCFLVGFQTLIFQAADLCYTNV